MLTDPIAADAQPIGYSLLAEPTPPKSLDRFSLAFGRQADEDGRQQQQGQHPCQRARDIHGELSNGASAGARLNGDMAIVAACDLQWGSHAASVHRCLSQPLAARSECPQQANRLMTERELELVNARRRFGRFIRRWRTSAGWSGATAENWASAVPDLFPDHWPTMGRTRLSRGQVSEIETGRAEKPSPITWLQLEMLNAALTSEERGPIAERRLFDQVMAAQPICHEDGRLWRAPDFFACWLGQLEPPAAWNPDAVEVAEIDPEETTANLRGAWLAACDDLGMGRGAGLRRLLQDLGPLAPQVEDDVVAVTDGIAPPPERLLHVAQLLQSWCVRQRERLTDRVGER